MGWAVAAMHGNETLSRKPSSRQGQVCFHLSRVFAVSPLAPSGSCQRVACNTYKLVVRGLRARTSGVPPGAETLRLFARLLALLADRELIEGVETTEGTLARNKADSEMTSKLPNEQHQVPVVLPRVRSGVNSNSVGLNFRQLGSTRTGAARELSPKSRCRYISRHVLDPPSSPLPKYQPHVVCTEISVSGFTQRGVGTFGFSC
ncbi:hypothetical protein EDB85DRAFT_682053 [Lactarius pseudohatsudake]|nr:hypothetical protein EDB85DRAFT_682053 [Lactarius pseudohatsudake]